MSKAFEAAINGIIDLKNDERFEKLIYKLSYVVGTYDFIDDKEILELMMFLSDIKFVCDNLDLEVAQLKKEVLNDSH